MSMPRISTLQHVILELVNDDVRLAKHDEQIARAGRFQLVGHAQVLIHARLEHGQRAEIEPGVVDFGREGEAADDERVEQVGSLARRACPSPVVHPTHRSLCRRDDA